MNQGRDRPARVNLLLLWLAGISLRITILAVPPLLPAIHRTLRLSETAVGALSALPILLLALAAIPGSLLVARIGARRALAAGLLVVAIAGALRGAGASTGVLFLMTLLMGTGIAISQPALPSLVRQWFPQWTGPATAIYSNGFLIGELVAAAITAPAILDAMGGSWERALASWSVLVLLTGLAVLMATTHVPRDEGAPSVQWWPDWRNTVTWRLGLILGCASISYWIANAFIPDYLRASHHSELITPALTVLNLSQLPASVFVIAFPRQVVGRRWPVATAGVLIFLLTLGLKGGGYWVVAMGAGIGFASAAIFVLCLALPPILAGERDVHHVSAAMFTISYTCPFIGALAGGAIWDHTGAPITAFTPLAVAGLIMAGLAVGLRLPEYTQASRPPAAEA